MREGGGARDTDRQRHRGRDTKTETETVTVTDRDRDRYRHRQTDRQTDRKRQREKLIQPPRPLTPLHTATPRFLLRPRSDSLSAFVEFVVLPAFVSGVSVNG